MTPISILIFAWLSTSVWVMIYAYQSGNMRDQTPRTRVVYMLYLVAFTPSIIGVWTVHFVIQLARQLYLNRWE